MEAVRVPPSAWMTSQSMVIWRSPSALRSTTERRLRPIRRWISTVRPFCLPADASRRGPPQGGGGHNAVFGGAPAAPLALEPRRQAVFERRRDQYMGFAEFHETGAFRVFHHAALERNGA